MPDKFDNILTDTKIEIDLLVTSGEGNGNLLPPMENENNLSSQNNDKIDVFASLKRLNIFSEEIVTYVIDVHNRLADDSLKAYISDNFIAQERERFKNIYLEKLKEEPGLKKFANQFPELIDTYLNASTAKIQIAVENILNKRLKNFTDISAVDVAQFLGVSLDFKEEKSSVEGKASEIPIKKVLPVAIEKWGKRDKNIRVSEILDGKNTDREEKPSDFIKRVYARYIGDKYLYFNRSYLRSLDKSLDTMLSKELAGISNQQKNALLRELFGTKHISNEDIIRKVERYRSQNRRSYQSKYLI